MIIIEKIMANCIWQNKIFEVKRSVSQVQSSFPGTEKQRVKYKQQLM